MTPSRAIEMECRRCLGYEGKTKKSDCDSMTCHLNDRSTTSLKRIKAFCIECVPEQSIQGASKCSGIIGYAATGKCLLHPFRLGKNPNPRMKLSPGRAENLRPFERTGKMRP
jgi:hypothetical protein